MPALGVSYQRAMSAIIPVYLLLLASQVAAATPDAFTVTGDPSAAHESAHGLTPVRPARHLRRERELATSATEAGDPRRMDKVTPSALVAGGSATSSTEVRTDAYTDGQARTTANELRAPLPDSSAASQTQGIGTDLDHDLQDEVVPTSKLRTVSQVERTIQIAKGTKRQNMRKRRASSSKDGKSHTSTFSDGQSIIEEGIAGGMEEKIEDGAQEHGSHAKYARHGKAQNTQFSCLSRLDCEVVGCFPRNTDDTAPIASINDSTSFDFTCKRYTPNPGPCRSGLPFYKLATNDMSPSFCFHFCLQKGLDIAGLVEGRECRCAASRRLSTVWAGLPPPLHLLFEHQLIRKVPDSSRDCKITVYNYTGPIVNGVVPPDLSSYTHLDEKYVSTVVNIDQEYEWDYPAAHSWMSMLTDEELRKETYGWERRGKDPSDFYDTSEVAEANRDPTVFTRPEFGPAGPGIGPNPSSGTGSAFGNFNFSGNGVNGSNFSNRSNRTNRTNRTNGTFSNASTTFANSTSIQQQSTRSFVQAGGGGGPVENASVGAANQPAGVRGPVENASVGAAKDAARVAAEGDAGEGSIGQAKRKRHKSHSRRREERFNKVDPSQWLGLLQQYPQPYAQAPQQWQDVQNGNGVGYGPFPQTPQGPIYSNSAPWGYMPWQQQPGFPQQAPFLPSYPMQSWLQLNDTEQLKPKNELDKEQLRPKNEVEKDGGVTTFDLEVKDEVVESGAHDCVTISDDGDCTEARCACSPGMIKETLFLATGEECWACAPHCNANYNGCNQLPCRCDHLKQEIAVASHYFDNVTNVNTSCITCLTNDNQVSQPWPQPAPHDPHNLMVEIPYVIEEQPSNFALDQPRIDVLAEAIKEFEQMLPCVRFKFLPWATKNREQRYFAGHYIHVLMPPRNINFCLAQNVGNRRRYYDRTPFVENNWVNAYLRRGKLEGWKGPTLLWMGHCSSTRWRQRVLQELAKIVGLQRAPERVDAATEWKDPWTPVAPSARFNHEPHIEIFWQNIVNDSAKESFSPKTHSYTGSYALGLMDAYAGYAEYDYLSLLHPDAFHSAADGLEGKPAFRTLPGGVWDTVVGSARTFSYGDMLQLADMYQCNTDRFFVQQGYKKGQTVTSLHYHSLAHMVTSDLSSTQAWVVSKDQQKVEDWIEEKMAEYKWQLSYIRYMPENEAFTAYVDTNRWSRRRATGTADQRYHWGTNFESFKNWMTMGHKDHYVITDMAADGPYLLAVMTRMPVESNTQQSAFWSSNWTHVMQQIKAHAKLNPAYAITNLIQYSSWDDLGTGCCGGPQRHTTLMFLGENMTVKECKMKCAEYVNCGAVDVNSTGHCHVFSWDFECDGLNYECDSQKRSYFRAKEYNEYTTEMALKGMEYPEVCLGDDGNRLPWAGTEYEAKDECDKDNACTGVYGEYGAGGAMRSWYYCRARPKMRSSEDIWIGKHEPKNVTAHSHTTEWVVTLSTNTSIVGQSVKMCQNEPEAIEFINQAYSNDTAPARISTIVATHWGGFAIVMSVTLGDTGPPYWTPPVDRLQRYAINQPYIGFL